MYLIDTSSFFYDKPTRIVSNEEQFKFIADEFHLSSIDIEKQYELALKNRIEIPPILMNHILIDAIKILHIMIDELDENMEKYDEKFEQISKRLKFIQLCHKLFINHC